MYTCTNTPGADRELRLAMCPVLLASGLVLAIAGVANIARATDLTLTDAALTALDWHRYSGDIPPPDPIVVVAKRDIPGPGVEFDIRFPSNDLPLNRDVPMSYLSSTEGGTGCLVGTSIPGYDEYRLSFTFVAVDGELPGNAADYGIWVGTPFDWGYGNVSLRPGASKTSRTPIAGRTSMNSIGFNIFRATPQRWSPEGNTITLRLQAAEVVAISGGPVEDCNANDLVDFCEHGDADGDGSVSLLDFAAFQVCFTGDDQADVASCCSVFDLEYDNDVDLDDFVQLFTESEVFQRSPELAEHREDTYAASRNGAQ